MGAFAIAAAVVVPVLASVLYNYGALEVLGAGLGSLAGKELTLRWYEEGLTGGGQLIFDEERLSWFNGRVEGRPLVLCILGECYDVTAGSRFYFGKDEPYNCFIGRDGTRSFVTGIFTPQEATDDLSDFEGKKWLGIGHWRRFYRNHETYKPVGVLVGKYWNKEGNPTPLFDEILAKIEEAEIQDKEDQKLFPGCNSRFTPETGTEIWCSFDSGGVERGWQGFPRKKKAGSEREGLCVCVPGERRDDPTIEEFEGCDPTTNRCSLGK